MPIVNPSEVRKYPGLKQGTVTTTSPGPAPTRFWFNSLAYTYVPRSGNDLCSSQSFNHGKPGSTPERTSRIVVSLVQSVVDQWRCCALLQWPMIQTISSQDHLLEMHSSVSEA